MRFTHNRPHRLRLTGSKYRLFIMAAAAVSSLAAAGAGLLFWDLPALPRTILMHLNMHASLRVLRILNRMGVKRKDKEGISRANTFVAQAARLGSSLPADSANPIDPSWKGQQVISTVTDITVVALGPAGQPPQALLKLAHSREAAADLQRQARVLSTLRADPRLADWDVLLPTLLAQGQVADQYYVIEAILPGVDARQVLYSAQTRSRMLASAARAIGELHRRTAAAIRPTPELLGTWIDRRLEIIQGCIASGGKENRYTAKLPRIKDTLYWSLAGREVSVGWIHGDYGPGNILVIPDGKQVTGVVDWGLASPEDLPLLDLAHLLLSTRMYLQGRELGDVIRRLIDREDWTEEELALFQVEQRQLPGEQIDLHSLLIFAWLRHITSNLTKSPHYANHWLWITRNIKGVLEAL